MTGSLLVPAFGQNPVLVPSPSATPTASFRLREPSPTPTPVPSPTPTPAPDAAALVAEADGHFALRSIGAIDGIADPYEVVEAIGLYRQALTLDSHDLTTLSKLMRALHFLGAYTGADIEEKKIIFHEGRTIGQKAVDRLELRAKATRGLSRIEALRRIEGVPALYLWTAGHWGEWGLVRGKFTAARTGVAGKLRDLAETVAEIDPLFEEAAGYRILGRLHSEAPKIIFITGWVSHDRGIEYLRYAHQVSPEHPVTRYFLAQALLDHDRDKTDEALRLLELCANAPPRPTTVLEDRRYAEMARAELDRLRAAASRR